MNPPTKDFGPGDLVQIDGRGPRYTVTEFCPQSDDFGIALDVLKIRVWMPSESEWFYNRSRLAHAV